jgi:type IV fimbrial biogenesis protein FimT
VFSKHLKFHSARKNMGFSLIELMAVLGVLAILLTVGVPSFNNVIADNRLLSEVYSFRATLNNARTEALAQRTPVTVCRSSNGTSCVPGAGNWNEGYIAFTDLNDNGTLDPNGPRGDKIVQAKVQDNSTLDITYNPLIGGTTMIRFNSRGNALGFSGTIKLCDDRGATKARGMAVSNFGSVQALVDSDDPKDGIVNDHLRGGSNVNCP